MARTRPASEASAKGSLTEGVRRPRSGGSPGGRSPSATVKAGHHLDVGRVREQVHDGGAAVLVARPGEEPGIPGEAHGVAGDEDEAGGPRGGRGGAGPGPGA